MAYLLPLTEIAAFPGAKLPQRPPSSCSSRAPRTERAASRVCLCGRVKDEEREEKKARVIGVTDPIREPGLAPVFAGLLLRGSTPPLQQQSEGGGGGGGSGDDGDRQRYYVNMGHAIRTLREEFPEIFYKEPSFDIYRDDIVFKDPFNAFVGIDNYKTIFRVLRLSGRILFKTLWIDIVSIWQPVENVIMIRWIAHGVPRVPWESHSRFDGTSEYKLDKNGRIFEHRVDNIALNSPTKFRVLPVEELIGSLGCPSTPKPTYFEMSVLVGGSGVPVLLRSTWTKCCLAFYLTLVLACTAKG